MSDKVKLLESAAKRVSQDKEFIAFYLERYSLLENKNAQEIQKALNCTLENYYKLGLCKAPQVSMPDFTERLRRISVHTQSSIFVLSSIVKRVSAIEKFKSEAGETSYLMAARDLDAPTGIDEDTNDDGTKDH